MAFAGGVLKITAHCLLDFLAGAQQPKHDEERHHGRNEIGVGYLPRSAMLIAMVVGFFVDYDDGLNAFFALKLPPRSRARRLVSGTPYPFPEMSA